VFNIEIEYELIAIIGKSLNGYTCKKNHPVRGIGSNESGQGIPMVPVRNQY